MSFRLPSASKAPFRDADRRHSLEATGATMAIWITIVACFPAEASDYQYDSMQRLTQVTHPDGTTIDYVYDALGNRLMKTTALPGAPSDQPPAAVTDPSLANGLTNIPATATPSLSPAVDPSSGTPWVASSIVAG